MRKLFLSCVSREVGSYRARLTKDLRRAKVDVRVQEDFGVGGGPLLVALDDYIRECDAVVHLIGSGAGVFPGVFPEVPAVRALLLRYPDMAGKLPVLTEVLSQTDPRLSYTQWEACLAIYHGRETHIYLPEAGAPRGPGFTASPSSDEEQRSPQDHFGRIRGLGWHRGTFENEERLSSYVLGDLRNILAPDADYFAAAPSRLPKKHDAGVFEGREKELAALDTMWADVLAEKAGRAQVVSLVALGGAGLEDEGGFQFKDERDGRCRFVRDRVHEEPLSRSAETSVRTYSATFTFLSRARQKCRAGHEAQGSERCSRARNPIPQARSHRSAHRFGPVRLRR